MSTVVIDFLPDCAHRYREGWTVVAIDVIRATTTAMTAAAGGRRVFPVPSIEAALPVAAVLDWPLLCGELGGNMPFGFDITNSPVAVATRVDTQRPLILLSSSGTQLIHNAAAADRLFLASLRNYTAVIRHLAARGQQVAVIGAGTRGEFREEDQRCCSLIAEGLLDFGFTAADDLTLRTVQRWQGTAVDSWQHSKSVDYLRRSEQLHDLDFILNHIDDLDLVFPVIDGEVLTCPVGTRDVQNPAPLRKEFA
jgi:2-phosphosulfolactate phosphatase